MKNSFKYDNSGNLIEVSMIKEHFKVGLLIFLLGSLCGLLLSPTKINYQYLSTEKEIYIPTVNDSINLQKVYNTLVEWNVKYPEVVLAQCMIESAYLSSTIFKENHNLFGMKVATTRPTTAKGTRRNHAYYDNWIMSIIDYALWQAAFTRKLKTEKDYINYLNQVYAEDNSYTIKIYKLLPKIKKDYGNNN